MKKIISAVFVVVLLLAPMAFGFTVSKEIQTDVGATNPTRVLASRVNDRLPNVKIRKAVKPGPSEVKKLENRLISKKNGLIPKLSSDMKKGFANLTSATNGAWGAAEDAKTAAEGAKTAAEEANQNINTVYQNLTNEKVGAFKKTNDTILSVGNKVMITGAIIILVIMLVGVAVFFLFKRSPNKGEGEAVGKAVNNVHDKVVEKSDLILDAIESLKANVNIRSDVLEEKVDRIEDVLAFDERPIEVVAGGHKIIFQSDRDVLKRKAYQLLFVEDDVNPAATVATYELQERSRRDKAEDALRRTMREKYNGKLESRANAGDVAAKLTIELIDHLQNTTPKRLKID